jgi:tetratricopeptide (TPR) repeat protein
MLSPGCFLQLVPKPSQALVTVLRGPICPLSSDLLPQDPILRQDPDSRLDPNLRMVRAIMTSHLSIDLVFQLLLDLPHRRPATASRRLEGLFRELSQPEPERPVDDIEDLIWALWISHEDRVTEETMGAAIEAMASGALKQARPLLDHLVEKHPDWAEAWNKRATLAFIEKRDADGVGDIERTLLLEPRHFGAVSGFGQICLRNGYLNEARVAFRIALTINPHLQGLQELIDELDPHKLMLH